MATRRRVLAGVLTAAALAGVGALAVPSGSAGWQPVSYARVAPHGSPAAPVVPAPPAVAEGAGSRTLAAAPRSRALSAAPERILPAEVSAARPVRVVGTALDAGGRPVITVHEARDRATATRLVRQAQQAENALGVEVDGVVHTLEAPGGSDPLRSRQWDLTRINAPAAWARSTGAGVTVAVIDTGVDARHPDLAGQVLTGWDAIAGRAGGDTDPQGHGTHVAGTVAALTGNAVGVSGVAPDVRVLPVRVLNATGSGYDSDTAEGIVWAADNGADVINLSLGGTAHSSAVTSAVAYARSRGVVVVAAAGNERTKGSPASYPGADQGVIAVAATDSADTVAPYSNAGDYVDVAAPGSAVLSTYPTALGSSGYATMSGTSMASPHVAAVAALLVAARPGLTPDQVESALEASAVDLGPAGRDTDYGHGRIDAAAALARIAPAPSPSTPPSPSASSPAPSTPAASPSSPAPSTPSPWPSSPAPSTPSPSPSSPAPSTPSPSPSSPTAPTPSVPVVAKPVVTAGTGSRTVPYGARTSTTFRVTADGRAWAGRPVSVCVSVAGRAWSCTPGRTSVTGTYTVYRTATAAFRVRLSVPATRTNTAASATSSYTLTAALTVTRSARKTLTVRVAGATGQKLTVQRYVGGRWTTVRTYPATSSRKITGLVSGGRYRVVLSSTTRVPGATSPAVRA
ncbi:S8 family peptidase [Actinoplanes teichomyceticus]|uniref:S8 family peptidase n=1 Tax=Actinoplanes teichomyceticus TaxID=1867 RepID=UPI001A5C21B8|nr:S8 family peptidase [Actinoplanes teichomyceticus]GIF13025.1 hypothetical protein Ate01nite_30570 [Actinoplanes teichomyceticus]